MEWLAYQYVIMYKNAGGHRSKRECVSLCACLSAQRGSLTNRGSTSNLDQLRKMKRCSGSAQIDQLSLNSKSYFLKAFLLCLFELCVMTQGEKKNRFCSNVG